MMEESRESVGHRRRKRYQSEDTSLTSKRELMGWYAYGLAAEVFAVCGVGSFLPVTMEQLARERGVLWSDKTTRCVTSPGVEDGAANSNASLSRRETSQTDANQCVIMPFGREITTSSFAMYTFSLAVLVQAVVLVSFSSFADYGNYRKRLLLGFGFTGATASMLFLLVVPQLYVLGALLVIVGVTCLGSSFVVLNSFLPLLVANHESVHAKGTMSSDDFEESSSVPRERDAPSIAYPSRSHGATGSVEIQLSTKISSKGVGMGYCAAVFVQILSIILLLSMTKLPTPSSPTIPLRLVLFMVGVWWFAFTIPSALWLRERPGPPLETITNHRGIRSCLSYVSFAWISLFRTIRLAVRMRQTVLFLAAWFLLSDAVATVSGTAILFARTELQLSTVAIAILSITATASGIAGAFTWPIIQRTLGLQTNRTIMVCIALMELIPIYGLLAYLPFVKAWGVGGLQRPWEIYPLAFIHGFVMGGLSSYCRSFFGLLIPPGNEAAFYALFAVTDKGSSAIGPAIVGAIVDRTGQIRPAFGFLAVLIVLPLPLVWFVDAERGRKDAVRMSGSQSAWGGDNNDRDIEGPELETLLMEERTRL